MAGYLEEMARVVRPGGAVAFDMVTEPCLDEETVRAWARDASFYRPVPQGMGSGVHAAARSHPARLALLAAAAGTAELLVFHRDRGPS